jgi:2-polyprenyl-3-methyl-5-hydroxy-6-metoxy-1,4-benzoquinol methylase
MLYRVLRSLAPSRSQRSGIRSNRTVRGAGGWGHLRWLNGEHTANECPVCKTLGPHSLILSVPSLISRDVTVTFVQCRICNCAFVVDYQRPSYETTSVSAAPLRFYVEQGAGLDTLARAVFIAGQKPAKSYLDIGCGFGFGVDMATRIFGWNAIGLDPGALAAAGREMLGIRIESDSAVTGATAPYDVIVCMEVLEHIADPHVFLTELRSRLSDAGTLIISTPNARYLDTDPNGDMLLPLLSGGYHAILYTAEALANIVRQTGFPGVRVVETPASLFAVASSSGRLPDIECEIDRGAYVGYLRSRFSEVERGSPVHTGFGYRLLSCLTADLFYKEALEVFDDLRDTIMKNYRVDLHNPLTIAGDTLERRIPFTEVPEKFPFCLAGLLACRGSIAADYEGRPEQAACYFIAARFSAQMLLRALDGAGMSDGELATLPERTLLALTAALQTQAKRGGEGKGGSARR